MSNLKDVKLINLPSYKDDRGILTSIESGIDIPFSIKRIFYMHHIILDRGGHAHIDTDQIIIASCGNFKVDLFDGVKTQTYKMDDSTIGLYVPRMIFQQLYDFSECAVCLVLANTHYDISKSLRSLEEYLEIINNNSSRD
ncbi:MAG: FdtA/QdtA family cupin domain-containing protein [bacterium]|nr:FdtA/QdtA family cupin domain-containing protein [bacterium]